MLHSRALARAHTHTHTHTHIHTEHADGDEGEEVEGALRLEPYGVNHSGEDGGGGGSHAHDLEEGEMVGGGDR